MVRSRFYKVVIIAFALFMINNSLGSTLNRGIITPSPYRSSIPADPGTFDAGDDISSATNITAGNYIGSLTEDNDENDYYKIFLNVNETIKVQIGHTHQYDFDAYLYNPSEYQVDSSTGTSTYNEYLQHTATTAGYHYIEVSYYSGDELGKYAISITITNYADSIHSLEYSLNNNLIEIVGNGNYYQSSLVVQSLTNETLCLQIWPGQTFTPSDSDYQTMLLCQYGFFDLLAYSQITLIAFCAEHEKETPTSSITFQYDEYITGTSLSLTKYLFVDGRHSDHSAQVAVWFHIEDVSCENLENDGYASDSERTEVQDILNAIGLSETYYVEVTTYNSEFWYNWFGGDIWVTVIMGFFIFVFCGVCAGSCRALYKRSSTSSETHQSDYYQQQPMTDVSY